MNVDREFIINQYVSRIETNKTPHEVYNNCVQAMAKIPFLSISETDTREVIQNYLNVWGKMGRVVGRNDDWQRDLTNTIREKANILDSLRTKNLENETLHLHETAIKECYEAFQKILWQVAAAKVLHLLCPDFFPPWDNDIAKGYRVVVGKNEHIEHFSPDDYFRFMKWIQEFIMNNSKILSELAVTYGKTKVKISDECLLYAVRNPFSHILLYY
jgi:hypothetical protein